MDEIAEAAERLRMIIRLLNRRAQADTGEGSPTRSERAVLAWLEERGPLTLTALATIEHDLLDWIARPDCTWGRGDERRQDRQFTYIRE